MTQLSNNVDDSSVIKRGLVLQAKMASEKEQNRIEYRRTSTRAFNPDGYCRLTDGQLLSVRRKTKRRRRRQFPLIPTYLSTQAHAQGIYTKIVSHHHHHYHAPLTPNTSAESKKRYRRSVCGFFSLAALCLQAAAVRVHTHSIGAHFSSFLFLLSFSL